ncbi:MAG: serine--tRNA ligase [Nanoarchaeota archaeon]|nr:serine--tRNA ligase [Nanoarchaeota archaeon]
MLDIRLFREDPDKVRKDLMKRKDKGKLGWVDKIIGLDKEGRKVQQDVDKLRHERNEVSKKINELKKKDKDPKKELVRAKEIPAELKALEEKQQALSSDITYFLMRIPNIMHPSVPVGDDDTQNEVIRSWGMPKKPHPGMLSHGEFAEKLGADFERSAKIAGTGFYFLKGNLALLNQALIWFATQHMVKKGYTYVEPPLMMRKDFYKGVTDLEDFKKVMYKVEGEDGYLIATSEHPLVGMYANETLDEKQLPMKMCGYSMCFRREIGSHGVDTKGLFRTHQFNKVEQVVISRPEESWELHEELQRNAEEVYEQLELPYRVVNVCTGDLGIVASKKYDIEVWMPKQEKYREVGSCSNCTEYQARRLGIKYKEKEEKRFVHTLNNTVIATSRVLVAILENFQNEDGTLTIPEPLRPLMGGMNKIKPENH